MTQQMEHFISQSLDSSPVSVCERAQRQNLDGTFINSHLHSRVFFLKACQKQSGNMLHAPKKLSALFYFPLKKKWWDDVPLLLICLATARFSLCFLRFVFVSVDSCSCHSHWEADLCIRRPIEQQFLLKVARTDRRDLN